eukprot:4655844-Amphidinium_carterae.1
MSSVLSSCDAPEVDRLKTIGADGRVRISQLFCLDPIAQVIGWNDNESVVQATIARGRHWNATARARARPVKALQEDMLCKAPAHHGHSDCLQGSASLNAAG